MKVKQKNMRTMLMYREGWVPGRLEDNTGRRTTK